MAGIVNGVAGLAVGFGVQAQPQAQAPQGYYYGPSASPVPVAPSQSHYYHTNSGTSTIQGDLKQDGTFKGHGTGARIQGGFTASGDIQ